MQLTKLSFSRGEFDLWKSCSRIRENMMLVPDSPGIYGVLERSTGVLLYVGMARGVRENKPRSLRNRLIKEHLYERARGSALRRHVARELGIPVVLDHGGKETVDKAHEGRISRFLDDKVSFAFIPLPWPSVPIAEKDARRELRPKWNPL